MGKATAKNLKDQTKLRLKKLGMGMGTAQYRLMRAIISKTVIGTPCFKCGKPLDATWTIEHKIPWLNADNPVEMFFDVNNISFSHKACNTRWK